MQHTTAPAVDAPSPVDELEDLLSQSTADLSLDDLLAESMTNKRIHDRVKIARQSVAKGGMSADERDTLNNLVSSWERKREWDTQAAVIMFARQCCHTCGMFHTQFQGYFQRQTNKQTSITRWIAAPKPQDDALPREVKYEDSIIEICHDCADESGWELEE